LTVQVYNVLGRPATTVPGVVLGVLYNSSYKEVAYMNSSGYLNFYGVSPGTYTLEVYHYPNTGLNLTEYWGGMTVNLQPGNNFVTFYRHEPWIYNLQVSASNREIVVTVTVNGTVTSPTQGEIELWVTNNPSFASPYSPSKAFAVIIEPGLDTFNFTYPVSQAGTYYVYTAVLTYISTYTVTDQWNWVAFVQVPQNYQVVLNLLNGQQYFGVPHVYQGDNDGRPTNRWPVYYGPNNASQYWSQGNITSNQPVLELVPSTPSWASGAMFWSETYSGGLVRITFIGTQTAMGNGFIIYLFLKPTKWAVSPNYNYTIPYNSTAGEGWLTYAPSYPSRVEGDVIYPQSSTPYIVVQWDPVWQFWGYTQSGATGQWNVWIVSNPSGNNASITPNPSPNLRGYSSIGLPFAGWDGIGTGAFLPRPGDRINITVTYDPSTNTLTGIAMDLNNRQSANFTLNLGNYYTPPSSQNYVFGVGATGPYWALLYVATSQQSTTPPTPSFSSTGLYLIPYLYNSSSMGAVYLNFTKAELELFMPPVMFGNLSIPGIVDYNNMSYFVHTLEGPYVFNTTLGAWKVYGFTFVALPTYGNGSVVNPTYMLQKTMIIAYNGGKAIVLLYYRNLAPVPLELNQYWSHIHKGVDGLYFTVYPDLFNPYANATEQVIKDAYYIDGNTSLYVNGRYLGQLSSFGLWQVLPVGPITLKDNVSGWDIQLIPINNLSSTQQIQLVTNGFSIDNVNIANSFLNIQHAEITLLPNQSAHYVYSIGISTQAPNYTEIGGILSQLIQIASSSVPSVPNNTSSTLVVTVYNVNGMLASSLPGVVYGILVNDKTGQQVAKAFTNSQSLLIFNGIPQGNYTLFVYHYPNTGLNFTEFWGIENVSVLPGKTVYLNFTRHEPWIYNLQAIKSSSKITINVTVDDPINAVLHGELYTWVTTSPQTANPSEPTIDTSLTSITIGPGLNKFIYYYATTQNGTYYIYVTLMIYNGTQLITTDQWNWVATTVQSYSSSLTVQVYNVLGRPATTVPGVVLGVLYNSSYKEVAYMNSSGYLNFYGVSPGTYTLEVYHYPNTGLNLTEYWGGMTVNLQPGNNFVTFYRHEPWIYAVDSTPLLDGSVVIRVQVYNPLNKTVAGEIDVYVNTSSQPNNGTLNKTIQVTISSGLNSFSFVYIPKTGEFYLYTVLKVNLANQSFSNGTRFIVTDQYNWTLVASLKGPVTVYVPVWFNGITYYVYWDINGVPSKSVKSIKIGLDPYSFLHLVLQLYSSRGDSANIKFIGITYQNNTPLTNTSMEEQILEYLYLWILLGGQLTTIVQNYGINSPGYEFIGITIQSGIPTLIEFANGITNVMYYLLDFVEVIEPLVTGKPQTSLAAKATVSFFKLLDLYLTHKLQKKFGNQEAQEIEELFKQYHLQASNYIELLQEFSSLPPSEQENFIASWYEITTGQTLPNPTIKAIDVLINELIAKGVLSLEERYADSLYQTLTSEGLHLNFASQVLPKFMKELGIEISNSIESTSSTASTSQASTSQALTSSAEEDVGLEAFLLLAIANIIENAWNIPEEIVFSEILEYINLLNYNYGYIENYINEYETSSVANLTLASQLYSSMILNNLWWSTLWYKFYTMPWFYHNNNYLLWSQVDKINAVDMIIALYNLKKDASSTLKWGNIPLIFIFDQNIYTPIVPQYSSFSNFFLQSLRSLEDFFTSAANEIGSLINNIANAIWTIIDIFGDPPLVVINVNSTYILLNGTIINTNNPFVFILYRNNTYTVVLPISNTSYLGLESNETTRVMIASITNKTTSANLTLSPYTAEILKTKGSNVSIMNTTTTISTKGTILLTGKNNLSFVWLSNGNLVVEGLPPGQYVVQKLITNTTIQQTSVSSQNTTEIAQISVGPSATTAQSSYNNNLNMLPILVLVVLVVVLAVTITLYKRFK
jgi:hypothetical protein